jgi:hypothetical protein
VIKAHETDGRHEMNLRIAGTALTVMVLAFAPACSMPKFHAGPHVGFFDIDGDVEVGGVAGPVKVKGETDTDEMGFDREVGLTPRVEAEFDDFILGLGGVFVGYEGDGTLESELRLGDRDPITAGSRIESEFSLGYLTLDALYRILGPDDFVDLAVGLGLGAVTYDLEIKSKAIDRAKVAVDDTMPFGYLAGRIAKDLGPVRLTLIGHGLGVELDDEGIFYFEVDGSAAYRLWGEDSRFQGRILAGYRYMRVGYELDKSRGNVDIEADIHGPYLALIFTF